MYHLYTTNPYYSKLGSLERGSLSEHVSNVNLQVHISGYDCVCNLWLLDKNFLEMSAIFVKVLLHVDTYVVWVASTTVNTFRKQHRWSHGRMG